MNAAQLLAHFELLVDTPEAVPRLRRFILDLAVRGKLVEQYSGDEPAASLLLQISAEWMRLQEDGTAKKGKDVKELDEKDGPFALPSQWRFVCLGDVLRMFNGRAFKTTEWLDDGLQIIRIQNLNNPSATFNFCDPATVDERHLVKNGDLLISWSGTPGTSFGAFIWERGDGALNQHIFRCVQVGNAYDLRFLRLAINTQLSVLISQAKGGVGLQHVTKGTLEKLPLALPPLGEQHRIVAKVEELLRLCEQLETAQQERERRRDHLVTAALERLSTPVALNNSESHRESASFYLQQIADLTNSPNHIKALRQAILDQAIQGHLVPQDANDEPASVLLERIISEVQSYSAKNRVPTPSIEAVERGTIPFAAPSGWVWTRLASICRVITDGDHLPPPKSDDGVAFLTIGNISSGHLDFSNCRYVPSDYFDKISPYRRPTIDDILYTVVGATYGRPVMVDTTREFCVQRHIAILKPAQEVSRRYLHLLLKSPYVYAQATSCLTGTAQPTVPLRPLRNFLIPLPPLAEQRRIASKVDELIVICENLESLLSAAKTDNQLLLDRMFDEAMGISRASKQKKHPRMPSTSVTLDHEQEEVSHYMASDPVTTVAQLIECVDELGGAATPERLLKHAGLSEDIETFYDIVREARDSGSLLASLGSSEAIRKPV